MRKTFFATLFTLLFCLNGQSQSCLPNGITFSTQAEIDNFSSNYPGCTMIEGDVKITAYPNQSFITNLIGLSGLTAIGGNLLISDHPEMTSLAGLENITTIGKDLQIEYLPTLMNLNGLQNITTVGGYLHLKENYQLQNLDELTHLTQVEGIIIWYNNSLTNFSALQNLTALPGDISIFVNPALTSLSGLENLTSMGGSLWIANNQSLASLSPLANLKSIGGGVSITHQPLLADLSGLEQITSLGGTLELSYLSQVSSFSSLENITSIGGRLRIESNPALASLDGLKNITSVSGDEILLSYLPGITSLLPLGSIVANCQRLTVSHMAQLTSLDGLENVSVADGYVTIANNPLLTSISSLNKVTTVWNIDISNNDALTNLDGLENLTGFTMFNFNVRLSNNANLSSLTALSDLTSPYLSLTVDNNPALTDLKGLENITGGYFDISNNPALTSLSGLENVASTWFLKISGNTSLTTLSELANLKEGYSLVISNNPALTSLSGLDNLEFDGSAITIEGNSALNSLTGLGSVMSVYDSLTIKNNASLTNLGALNNLTNVGSVNISGNPSLFDCAVFAVCNHLLNNPALINITNNATGCNTPAEVEVGCNNNPVTVEVLLDNNGDEQPDDPTDSPLENIRVSLSGDAQMNLRPTDANGFARFGFLENGTFSLGLPQVPDDKWKRTEIRSVFVSSTGSDSTYVQLLLTSLVQCPELTTTLGMPAFFRGCLVNSAMEVSVQNTGGFLAEGAKLAVVMPSVLELVTSMPLVSGQNGDTLYFELGDLKPFETAAAHLTVKTKCDTFLFAQTLCIEAFAAMDNPCPNTLPAHSEIKLSAKCVGDTIVRFSLKNIGDAPTQGLHEYKIIRNEAIQYSNTFNLNAQQSLSFDFPADSATWRMEATKFDDGTPTAVALENCGGLTPGYITAFWLDGGPVDYDFNCRQVIGSYDPNLKSAMPTGVGWNHQIVANRPIQYTIDFQNTGTDTAFRVLLRDELPPQLDINTFRPGFSSHPCTWEINGNKLEVLFFPIALPDSNVNEPASHGFFSFTIDQKPNLPDGTYLQNTASIIFDFNPPIWTNTIYHLIGKLTVRVDEAQSQASLWRVWGNPVHDAATFRTEEFIAGEKRFELYDAAGRLVRSAQFSGQEFEFQRDLLPAGLYFFRIGDAQGRRFTGKIVVAD